MADKQNWVNYVSFYETPQYSDDDWRQKLAQALLQNAGDTSYAANGWVAGARILQGVVGAILNNRLRKQENAYRGWANHIRPGNSGGGSGFE